MIAFEPAVWLSAGYGIALLLVAYGVDFLARRAHRANDDQQTKGFRYHEDHDAWLCPQDQWLWPQSFDPDNRVMRYRGSPSVCNACPVKDSCTSSDDGREIGRKVDAWPSSESARFHRGIACVIHVLAVVWPAVSAFLAESSVPALVLLATALFNAVAGIPLWSHLRRTTVDPEGVLFRSLDENLDDRARAVEALDRRRTTYASDRRDVAGASVRLKLGPTRYVSERRENEENA